MVLFYTELAILVRINAKMHYFEPESWNIFLGRGAQPPSYFSQFSHWCMPECFKDDIASQWKSGKFETRCPKPINRWSSKCYVIPRGPLRLKAEFHYNTLPFPQQICENAVSFDVISRNDVPFGVW